MELIRKLGTRKDKKGYLRSYALFWCDYCKQEVERILSKGKKQKSCGCAKGELIAKSKIGKKYTIELRQKLSISHLGQIPWNKNTQGVMKAWNKGLRGIFVGELSPNWQGGISDNQYPIEFNKELKQFILERDNYTCQCPDCEHKSIKLHVHHIDYNKQNNNPENFITLCHSCHMKTNGKNNRQYWTGYYKEIRSVYL